jgi:hypothetical protein
MAKKIVVDRSSSRIRLAVCKYPKESIMSVLVAILLAIAWIIGIGVVKVSSFAIHILLALALVSVVAHLLRWRGRHT